MPAKSDKQQTAARIAHAIKKGKVKPKKGTASAQMAKGMSDKQIKHFMVKEEDGGTTSVNIGTSSSKPAFPGAAPPFKKKAEKGTKEKKKPAFLKSERERGRKPSHRFCYANGNKL